MKVAILAGGVGSRLAEETEIRPKPMVEIGGRPILWHIMKHYYHYGFKEFVIALGYKGEYIKRYMMDYCSLSGNLKLTFRDGRVHTSERPEVEDWTVELIDTGLNTNTGGRIKRLGPYVGPDRFLLTWGDGVSDVSIPRLLDFHLSHGRLATVTAVRPTARFGKLDIEGNVVTKFSEKPLESGWINGAFFVLEKKVLDYIAGDDTGFEKESLERLAREGQLMAYQHEGFWQCMDTLREKKLLEGLWNSGNPPWKLWR
jgi:glucose-1-phosphate cytidylyltransferase